MFRKRMISVTLLLLLAALLLLSATPVEAKHPYQGYIYGKVTTRSGNTYVGLLRWDDEEAFWDDLFHSYKENRPYAKELEKLGGTSRGISKTELRKLEQEIKDLTREEARLAREEEKIAELEEKAKDADKRLRLTEERAEVAEERAAVSMRRSERERERAEWRADESWRRQNEMGRRISVLGGAIDIAIGNWSESRIFIARFGDIQKITVIGSEDAELLMKSGEVYTVSGYSNDVGGEIHVRDNVIGAIDLDWKKIDTIEFMETPKNVTPEGYRLHGTLLADGEKYVGYIQWDSEECLSTDILDGESEDGDLEIPMGNIRVIERRSRSSSWVEFKDGRRLSLEGTNDVDGSIRGIMVEDDRYGRLKTSWDAFEKVTFDDEGESGRAYSEYKKGRKLEGTVTDIDGNKYEGFIVYDIDESETWEMLNGDLFDVEFDIPFERIKSITPRSRNSATVVLTNGETLRLEGGQDMTSKNDGILIYGKDKKEPEYVAWDNLETIEFK